MESKNKILWELKVEYDGAVEQLRKYSNEVLKIEEDLDKKLAKKNQLIGKAKVMKGKISDETDEKKASKMQAEYGETVDKIRKVGAEVKKLENQFDLKKAQKEYFTKKTDYLKDKLEAETEKTQGVQETTQAQEETKEAVQETVQAKEQERQEIEKVGNEAVDMQKLQAEAAEKAKQVYEDEIKEIERLGTEMKKISEDKSLTMQQKRILQEPFKREQAKLLMNQGFAVMNPPGEAPSSASAPAVEEKVAEKAAEAAEETKALNEQLEKQEEATTKIATAEEILNANLEKNKKLAVEAAREMSNKYDMFNVKQSVETAKNDMKVGLKELYGMYSRGFSFGGGGTAATAETSQREALIKDMNSILERDARKAAVAYDEVKRVIEGISAEIARIKASGLPMQEMRDLMAPFEGKYNLLTEIAGKTSTVRTRLNEASEAAGKLSRNINDAGNSMRRLSRGSNVSTLQSSVNDMNKSIKHGMLNVIKYGLGFRSVYFFVRKIREVIISGLKEFAKFDPETNKTMTNLSNKLSDLKVSLVSAFSPIMSVLEPALIKVMSVLEKAFDYVGMFFALLRGDSTYKKAIAVQRNYADSLNDTAEAAKEAKTYLSGLDEIRVYDTGKDTSSSSGSGSGDSTLMGGIKEVEIDEKVKKAKSWWDSYLEWWDKKDPMNSVVDAFCDLIDGTLWKKIKKVFVDEWENITTTWTWIWNGLKKIFVDEWNNITTSWSIIWKAVRGVFADEWENIVTTWTGIWNGLKKVFVDEWNNITTTWSAIWDGVKRIFTNAWNSIKDSVVSAWERVKTTVRGWISAAWQTITDIWQKIVDSVTAITGGVGSKIAQAIQNGRQKLSEIKNNIVQWATNIKQNLGERFEIIRATVENKISAMKNGIADKFYSIKSKIEEIIQRIKDLFHFNWEFPRIKVPKFTWWTEEVLGGIVKIPHVNVSWDYMAKGGILDRATWLGGNKIAGEAGKEAVIPLERNTEWIRKVAEELADILVDRLGAILNSYPMPAVASGTLIPPRIEVDIDGLDAIDGKLSQIIDRMSNRGGSYSFTAQLNRRTLFQEVIQEAKIAQSTTGRNPFDLR